MVKNLPAMPETQLQSQDGEGPLEKEVATLSSNLIWRIPWTGEPGRLQSMGSQRVRHDLATKPPHVYTLAHTIYTHRGCTRNKANGVKCEYQVKQGAESSHMYCPYSFCGCTVPSLLRAGSLQCTAPSLLRAGSVQCSASCLLRAGSLQCSASSLPRAGSLQCSE